MLSQSVENELLLAVGIVIAIAEPLETLLRHYAFFEELNKGIFRRRVSKIGFSSLQTLPSASLHNTFTALQLTTPSLMSQRMTASSILLNELVILLGCCPFAIVLCIVVVSSFRECALLAIVVRSSVRKTAWNL